MTHSNSQDGRSRPLLGPLPSELVAKLVEAEVTLTLYPRECGGGGFRAIGTRQAIEDAGLVTAPLGFRWPEAKDSCSWRHDGRQYHLHFVPFGCGGFWMLSCCADAQLSGQVFDRRRGEQPATLNAEKSRRKRLREQLASARADEAFQQLWLQILPPVRWIPRCYVS